MAIPTVAELKKDLMDRISDLDCIKTRGRDLFNIDDFGEQHELSSMPTFGTTYEGAGVVENQAEGKSRGSHSVAIISLFFATIVVVEYTGGNDQNSVSQATEVLDAIRKAIHGYRGIGSRVWMFNGESPYKQVGEGKVYYIQNWKMDIPLVGTSTT
jgi:hypothetical protein